MNVLTHMLDTASASGARWFELLSVAAGCGLGALGGHRWQSRSRRASGGRRG